MSCNPNGSMHVRQLKILKRYIIVLSHFVVSQIFASRQASLPQVIEKESFLIRKS